MSAGHRVRQFARHLSATVTLAEDEAAASRLPGAAGDLYRSMPVADRRHGLDVVAHLEAGGLTDPDLVAAALLHDAAKGHRLRLGHRVAVVLLAALPGDGVKRLAVDDPRSWRYPFHLQIHHVELSAVAALDAGCSARTAAFIQGAAPDSDRVLQAALAAADAAS
jgi:hypothetical protein